MIQATDILYSPYGAHRFTVGTTSLLLMVATTLLFVDARSQRIGAWDYREKHSVQTWDLPHLEPVFRAVVFLSGDEGTNGTLAARRNHGEIDLVTNLVRF